MTAATERRVAIELEDRHTGSASGRQTEWHTIGVLLDQTAQEVPGREALISCHQKRRYTYRELQDEVDRCARGLLACAVRQLDRVAIWSPQNAERVIVQLALAKIGAVLVCLDPAWDSAGVVAVLRQSHASLLIIAASQREADDLAVLSQICPEVRASPRGQIRSSHLPALHTVVALGTRRPSGAYHWGDLLALAEGVSTETLRARQAEERRDDPATLPYAWTMSGVSRSAAITQGGLLAAAARLAETLALTREDRLCVVAPFFPRSSLEIASLTCLTRGATMILPAAGFDPPSLLQTVQEEKCTAIYAAPSLFGTLLAYSAVPRYDLSTLRRDGSNSRLPRPSPGFWPEP